MPSADTPISTTKEDVATLLENFAEYVNPAGKLDPWFSLDEINQQFAWEDVPKGELIEWLNELVVNGKAIPSAEEATETEGMVWRWLS